MQIELLVVLNCPHETDAADLIATAVADTGVKAVVTRTVVSDEDMARQRGFTGSPTILVNGADPFATPDGPVAVACRLYATPDGLQGTPGLRGLRQALKRAAAAG